MRVRVSRRAVVLAVGAAVMGIVGTWHRGGGVSVLWAQIWPWLVVVMAALLHELGHVIAAWSVGVGIQGLRLDLFGARMELQGMLSYGRELWVAAGGPLVNLLSVAFVWPIQTEKGGEGIALFLGASLILGGVNLLPVGTLDGGRMLRCAIAWLGGDRVADRALQVTTGIFLGLLWMLAVYVLLRKGQMLSVFVFSLCLLARAVSGKEGV